MITPYIFKKKDILFTEPQIKKRIQEIAGALHPAYKNKNPVVVAVLKGAFVFFSDLLRMLDFPTKCDFCRVSSYGMHSTASTEIKIQLDLQTSVEGQHIILVEDIIDRGLTIQFLKSHLKQKRIASLCIVSLIVRSNATDNLKSLVDYAGFEVKEDHFLVGYGMDYKEQFRHLPFVAKIKPF